LHYRELKQESNDSRVLETKDNRLTLAGLNADTQYIIFVTVRTSSGESRPSETVLAWTSAVLPAIVEVNQASGRN
jgi:hypothetical protein